MGGNKDGLIDLLEAFAIVTGKRKDVRLNLAGSAPDHDLKKIKGKIKQLKLDEYIRMPGNLDSVQIPVLLANSDLLVLARPDNNQAKAGFPTKLGEYLASQKPVLITKTGEIPNYLTNNVSAYLAEPGNIAEFAEKMLFALKDPQAEKIGKAGFKIAEEYFDYKLYGKTLKDIFLKIS